ncbi:hypothetical protein [Weeksella virosa]|uniref:YD repeat protein n=1 Tax=Weeksella virosa (strain ATCC 43766 / DSM 16922 / JCM 21250 / CCUG 30538 / CDC 9751 / IAM 14551 / NBRC 16016 / NCTC 11634 / CL345/78) TaxID=865938 RepID=F0P181_WEEVC|nr:hypothetical protein [Weeksella virosa]ADX67580.1 YD repeat protein [Weeksella virosa DSM 16922]VEH64796.1 YD repeat (two copies) [Weeksella virosa]
MKKLLSLFLLFTIMSFLQAQFNQEIKQDFKPEISQFSRSAEVSAFSKYVDIPATTHTGVMNISIPIYSFDFDGQQFPISLEYNTSGIKLDEIASRVGLGWVLNIGGISLSKQVIGSPDRPQSQKEDMSSGFDFNGYGTVGSDTEKALYAIGDFLGEYPNDFLPDIYNYSLLKNTGQFIFDIKKKEALKIPSSNVKIKKIKTPHGFFDVVMNDDKGNEYYFSLIQSRYNVNTCTNHVNILNNYPSEEYIIKYIKSSNNIKIEFEYLELANPLKYATSIEIKEFLSAENNSLRIPLLNYQCTNYMVVGGGVVQQDKILSKVKFNNSELEIVYGVDTRKDVVNDKYIKSLIIRSNGKQIKKFELDLAGTEGYFVSEDDYNPKIDYMKGANYRLKLNGIEEVMSGEKYLFEYYEGNLPPRLTHKKDFWGVYNGRFGIFPKVYFDDLKTGRSQLYNSNADLSSDLTFGKIGNLKKVTYPTGGSQELFYENDDFFVPSGFSDFYNSLGLLIEDGVGKTGSIRVAKVILNDSNNNGVEKRFTYINPNTGKTSGINYGTFNLTSIKTDVILNTRDYAAVTNKRYNYLTNNAGWQLATVNGKAIGYSHVQEYVSNFLDSTENHKIEYEYFHDEEPSQYDWTSYNPNSLVNMSYPLFEPERGLLKTKRYYNQRNDIIKEEFYEYNFDPFFNNESSIINNKNMVYNGIELTRKNVQCAVSCFHEFDWISFPIKTFWIQNIKTTIKDYLQNGQVVTTLENNYSPTYKHLYPTNTITTNSKGETLMTEYQYPPDLATGGNTVWDKMVERNMIGMPVRTKTSNDGTVLSEQRTVYNNFGELILPQFVYAKKGEMGQTEAVADRKITYNSYDAQGNLTQYTMENGIPVSIIWGYNGQYPIAKIEGKAYSSISSHAEVLIAASNSISGLNVNSFNALRSSFPDALITGYIYQPLVGVTMIVQPNGQVEKYAYDAAGRLKEIRNHDNEILKTFEYNYAQP